MPGPSPGSIPLTLSAWRLITQCLDAPCLRRVRHERVRANDPVTLSHGEEYLDGCRVERDYPLRRLLEHDLSPVAAGYCEREERLVFLEDVDLRLRRRKSLGRIRRDEEI